MTTCACLGLKNLLKKDFGEKRLLLHLTGIVLMPMKAVVGITFSMSERSKFLKKDKLSILKSHSRYNTREMENS